jgi:hypothetical protein
VLPAKEMAPVRRIEIQPRGRDDAGLGQHALRLPRTRYGLPCAAPRAGHAIRMKSSWRTPRILAFPWDMVAGAGAGRRAHEAVSPLHLELDRKRRRPVPPVTFLGVE